MRRVGQYAPEVWRGFRRPLDVLGKVMSDPLARSIYLRTLIPQLLVIVAVVLIAWRGELAGLLALFRMDSPGVDVRVNGVPFWVDPLFTALVSLYATLCAVEWTVLALWRDHNEVLEVEIARVTGVPATAPPEQPRVRIDLRWLKKRLERRVGGWLVFAFPAPFLLAVVWLPTLGEPLQKLLIILWGTYLGVVMCAGKTHLAFETAPPTEYRPMYLRAWERLVARVPLMGTWLPRAYGRLWTRVVRPLFHAEYAVEHSRGEYAGLFLLRLVASVPIVSVFTRPLIPVAATSLWLQQRERLQLPPSP